MKQIFIVEDNEMYSLSLDYILSINGYYQFVHYSSGEECIRNINSFPAVVILDYGLPGIDGYETLIRLKEINPEIYVIILTERMDNELAVELKNAGADDYLLKQGLCEDRILKKLEYILNRNEYPDMTKMFFTSFKKFFTK
jgi:DNA-binding response OmpR family regulator